MSKPTEGDFSTIRYFWEEKGDVTSYVMWEELEPALRKTHPELVRAVENLEIAKRTISAIVGGVLMNRHGLREKHELAMRRIEKPFTREMFL